VQAIHQILAQLYCVVFHFLSFFTFCHRINAALPPLFISHWSIFFCHIVVPALCHANPSTRQQVSMPFCPWPVVFTNIITLSVSFPLFGGHIGGRRKISDTTETRAQFFKK
jgi:hypothetical protein